MISSRLACHWWWVLCLVCYLCLAIEISELPILGSSQHRIVSRVTRGLRLHRRQLNRVAHPIKPTREIDPIPDGPRVAMPRVSSREMKLLVEQATAAVDRLLDHVEPDIFNSGTVQKEGSSAWFAAAMAKTKIAAKNLSRSALIAEETTKLLADSYHLTKDQITFGLPTMDIRDTLLGIHCPLEVDFPCQPGKYRAFSGYCNNVQNPTWGNANIRYLRYASPEYEDGVREPRHSVSGDDLPSAREVSLKVHTDADKPHNYLTAILAILGEFVYHDLAHTAQSAGFHGHRIKCCGIASDQSHPECMPIRIPDKDPVYERQDSKCMEYTRSCSSPRIGCTLGPREQVNQVTSFLDGSAIYGSSVEEADQLRTFRGGELKTQRGSNGRELLPAEDDPRDCRASGRQRCFAAGDVRVNENAGLMIMHTMWVREHNRIARDLSRLNSHWNDLELYEEARRIVGAELQHITYKELLPAIMGRELMTKFDLETEGSGYFPGYDINVNAGLSNAVATAVFGFIFSMMPSNFDLVDQKLKKVGSRSMSQTFLQPSDMYGGDKMDQYIMGLVNQPAQARDEFVSSEMTNNLFVDPDTGLGIDMMATLIQQSRDHGLPTYIQWRKFCRLDPAVNSFQDLRAVMTPESIERLSRAYRSVHDVDLITGGLAEKPVVGAAVGPTFGCLLGRQFHYLRRGDRFWYENDIPPSSFSKDQLMEIRKTSLARILCDNSDGIGFMQPSTMLTSDQFLNAYQSCRTSNIPEVDLSKWKVANHRFTLPDEMLQETINRAKRQVADLKEAEHTTFTKKIGVAEPRSAQGVHLGFLRPKRQTRIITNQSLVLEMASQGFANTFLNRNVRDREGSRKFGRNVNELMTTLPRVDVSELLDMPKVLECDDHMLPCDHTARFRTMTGWCNNIDRPDLGKSFRIFTRMLPPRYEDGMSTPRQRGVGGQLLPPARTVSTTVHYDVSSPHVRNTLLVMQWGQFLDHDLTFTPMNEGFNGSPLNCKDCNSARTVHPACMPISIPRNDPFFPSVNLTTALPNCISFVRSMPGQLKLGAREQLNQVTTYLDASNVYGSDNCDAKVLRSFIGGRLNITRHPSRGKDLLPQTSTHKECRAPSGRCFEAGDTRASEQPLLAAMHTIWLREHNRIVNLLQRFNPHWSDELLYQHGRRILSALEQHVTYNEFLPRVLGLDFVTRFELRLEPETYFEGYDPDCDPTIFNEFGAAAFRFGHSLLRPSLQRFERNYRSMNNPIQLRTGFFNSDMLFAPNAIDHIMRGLSTTSMETLDNTVTQEVTNHLFEDSRIPFSGMDLVSFNLQRGRDHALAPYNDYRQICNLTRARTFEDLRREIPGHLIEKLKAIYDDVNDVDLFTGGLIETPLHGGLIGPTFGCIIGLQFRKLRRCDRFWYETGNPLVRFTEAQLAELRKVTLAKILCDNSDTIETMQRFAMDLPDPFLNPRVSCDNLHSLNLELWKERQSCDVNGITIDVGHAERISPCVMCTCTREGPICQSLRINNCFHLASSFSKESILSDHVCKVQCAFAFRSFPQVDVHNNNVLGFTR